MGFISKPMVTDKRQSKGTIDITFNFSIDNKSEDTFLEYLNGAIQTVIDEFHLKDARVLISIKEMEQ